MTLADFFLAVNAAGVQLAGVDGQLQLRGPANAITLEMKNGAAEHKAAILGLLAAVPAEEQADIEIPEATAFNPQLRAKCEAELLDEIESRKERAAITAEGNGEVVPDEAAKAIEDWDRVAGEPGMRPSHGWGDWRLEWQLEVGGLYLRMRDCQDPNVIARIRLLAAATPKSKSEWMALGQQIANTEHDLRQAGLLPNRPWPDRGE